MVSKLMRINFILFCLFVLLASNLQARPYYPDGDIETYIRNKKNEIQDTDWFSRINTGQLRYLRSIIGFFEFSVEPQNDVFPNTYEKVKTYDRGDLLLGLFSSTDKSHWVVSRETNYATYADYKRVVNEIVNKIEQAKLTYVNSQMEGASYKIKYHLGVVAGLSGAWNFRPDAKLQHKRMNAEESLRYAFRINQQGLRHAVLRHYIDELYEQKKETASFVNFVKDLCEQDFSNLQFLIHQISIVSAGPDMVDSSMLWYNRILEGLKNLAKFLFEMSERELAVLCAQANLLAWQSVLITVANELTLYQLSAIYNVLQHFEK